MDLHLNKLVSWLPDGIFSNQKSQILDGLAIEDVNIHILWTLGLFYDNLVYFMDICNILW
jgi:hypothetical protein